MTFTLKEHGDGTYYVAMEQNARNGLINVYVCKADHHGFYGYPLNERTYHPTEIKNAKATFNRYKKAYCN